MKVGYIILAIAGNVVFGKPSNEVMTMLKNVPRPAELLFVPSPDDQTVFEAFPKHLMLNPVEGHMMISSFQANDSSDPPQKLVPGSVLLRVNKIPLTGEMTADEVLNIIAKEVPCRVAYRDMDSFMHLIHLRDGYESLTEVHIINDVNEAEP